MDTAVLQQDSATPHFSSKTMEYLRRERLISQNIDFPWPPYSANLNLPDFFPWGYLMEKLYANNTQILDALKTNIQREVRNILVDITVMVIACFNVWVAAVIQKWGAWIEHMINYWHLTALNISNFFGICKDKMVILM